MVKMIEAMCQRMARRQWPPIRQAGGKMLIPQYFTSLQGEDRTREMLRLADWLLKTLSDGSRLLIQRPDGTLLEVNYTKK